MQFTDAELNAIDAALSVAASVYESDADTARTAGQERIALAFEAQARGARHLADKIGNR